MKIEQAAKVYIGLGANLGDPIEQILAARKAIFTLPGVSQGRSSSLYVSSPVGYDDQPDYVNCVLEMCFDASCRSLLKSTQMIELGMGRQRDPDNQNAARCIDIDILLFANSVIKESDLIVPHPRMHERLFVLRPLAELNQELASRYSNSSSTDFSDQSLYALRLGQ